MTNLQSELPDNIRQKIENGTLTGRDLLAGSEDPEFWHKMNDYFEKGGAPHIPWAEQQQIVGLLYQLHSDLVPAGYKDLERIRKPLDPEVEARVLATLDKIANRLTDPSPANAISSQMSLDFCFAASGDMRSRPEFFPMPPVSTAPIPKEP